MDVGDSYHLFLLGADTQLSVSDIVTKKRRTVCQNETSHFQGGLVFIVIDYVGYAAGFLVTFAFLPQIMRVYKLKSAREISLLFNTSTLLGAICWFTYGIVLGLVPIIVWNIIAILLTSLLMFYKLKYGRQ